MNKIFVFEGIDGAGKGTIVELVADELKTKKINKIKVFREPGLAEGKDAIGEDIRKLISQIHSLDWEHKYARLFLTMASRCELLSEINRLENHIILLDRFFYSTYAYQHYGYGIPLEVIKMCHKHLNIPEIDRVFLLDIDPLKTIDRGKKFVDDKLSFMNRVRDGYLQLAKEEDMKEKFMIIDATKQKEVIIKEILKEIKL